MRGLYAITPEDLMGSRLLKAVEEALEGGYRILQYRNKTGDAARRRQDAGALARLCRRHGARFIVNDDPELAAAVGADGVHLGRDDGSLSVVRTRLGRDAIIGISCYDDWKHAVATVQQGADYVAFGAFYPSSTKPNAACADLQLLERAHRELALPVVAIGGITPENAQPLIDAGADMVAVIQGLFGRPDIRAAAHRLSALFEESRGRS